MFTATRPGTAPSQIKRGPQPTAAVSSEGGWSQLVGCLRSWGCPCYRTHHDSRDQPRRTAGSLKALVRDGVRQTGWRRSARPAAR